MPSRKCVYCEIRWPKAKVYEFCPDCLERCVVSSSAPTLTTDEAEKLAKRAKFNWHLLNSWLAGDRVQE